MLLALLLGSIMVNYGFAWVMARRKAWLIAGLAFNLGLLGWFKYAGMFGVPGIVLPLGISFFTFQQIMFLVDGYRGEVKRPPFLDYACFIAFFPHLIAGPIVRPSHILPQIAALAPRQDVRVRLTEGVEIFLLGLAKKLCWPMGFRALPTLVLLPPGGAMRSPSSRPGWRYWLMPYRFISISPVIQTWRLP